MTTNEVDRNDRMRALVAEYRERVAETRSERIQRERLERVVSKRETLRRKGVRVAKRSAVFL